MLDGKKGVAQNILYDAFEISRRKNWKTQQWKFLIKQLNNIMPVLEVKCSPYWWG